MAPTERTTGLSNQIVLEQGGTDLFTEFDVNMETASHEVEIPSELLASVGSGVSFVTHSDGQVSVSGDMTLRAIDLKPLQILGSYSESNTDGDGTTEWQINSQDTLPEFQFKQQVTDSEILVLSGFDDSGAEPTPADGFKFDEATINIEKDSPVTIDLSGLGLYAELQDGSITTQYSTTNPENWLDAHVEIDGTPVGSLESAEITISRGAEAVRGIEQMAANYRLLPTEIVEMMRDISLSMTIEVTDNQAWSDLFDDDSKPLRPQDERSEHTVTVVLGSRDAGGDTNNTPAGELQLTGVQFENTSGELQDNAEVRTQDVEGNAIDWSVTGEVQ